MEPAPLARFGGGPPREGRGDRPGRRNPELDAALLGIYDRAVAGLDEKRRKSAPRELATRLKRADPHLFPATPGAVERHIRRLLKARQVTENEPI